MENGKQYVHMNHFTLGEKRHPVKKKQHPPISSRIFPFNSFLLHSIFHFPITFFLKSKSKYGSVCVGVLVETPREKCVRSFFFHPPFLQKIPTNKTRHRNPTWTWT